MKAFSKNSSGIPWPYKGSSGVRSGLSHALFFKKDNNMYQLRHYIPVRTDPPGYPDWMSIRMLALGSLGVVLYLIIQLLMQPEVLSYESISASVLLTTAILLLSYLTGCFNTTISPGHPKQPGKRLAFTSIPQWAAPPLFPRPRFGFVKNKEGPPLIRSGGEIFRPLRLPWMYSSGGPPFALYHCGDPHYFS